MRSDDDGGKLEKVIPIGSSLVGGSSAALIGLAAGDPTGLIGGLGGPLITALLETASLTLYRTLSGRQIKRIGAAAIYTLDHVKRLQDEGHEVRKDGFFDDKDDQPSSAEEITEGCFIAARDAYEEKKLPFIGKLLANIAFQDYPKDTCHHFVNLINRLTFRQLCLLGLSMTLPRHLRATNFEGIVFRASEASLLGEILELHQLGLVVFYEQDANRFLFPFNIRQIVPAFLGPDLAFGFPFIGMAGLTELSSSELEEIERILARPNR